MSLVACRMIEFHRYGGSNMILLPENRYIRTAGWDTVALEVSPTLDHTGLLRSLNALRYGGVASDDDVRKSKLRLAAEAGRFLGGVEPAEGELLQMDLVTNAAELWAFPFEACFASHPEWLSGPDTGVVVTRRIRGDFAEKATAWPVIPSVLFVHAPVTSDLEKPLVDAHVAALSDALAPWTKGKDAIASGLLTVREVTSVQELTQFRDKLKPAYVHLLAHGAAVPPDPLLPELQAWGLRLGYAGEPGVAPAEIASALQTRDGLPLVVTVSACDSANQASPAFAVHSVVQELHRCGVPVVIGSQLPLTKPGSRVLTRAFYERLLQGDDVRMALHGARVALHAEAEAGHDWLSLVAYVRLPAEGYTAYLDEVGLRMELRLLDAAQARADQLSAGDGSLSEFEMVENRLQRRLRSLEARKIRLAGRKDLLEEVRGLEASAYKRLAELLFVRGLRHDDCRAADWQASRDALTKALAAYRFAYQADLHSHWLGVQQLALETVLTGGVARPEEWLLVTRAAEIARDAPAKEGKEDVWSCGTLAELALIAPYAGHTRDVEKAKEAAALLVGRARKAGEDYAIGSTRRQIERYVRWWTTGHGFFPGVNDLSADAGELLGILT
jgi:hypothetical protein